MSIEHQNSRKELLIVVDELEDEPNIEDEDDDMDTSENPTENALRIDPSNFNTGILTYNQNTSNANINFVPSSICHNSMSTTKNRQMASSPVKKLFQLKFTSPINPE